MYVPRPHPFLHGRHVIYYGKHFDHILPRILELQPYTTDNNNKTEIFEKLDYYRQQRRLAEKIAVQGYLHALKHHRSVNLIDYVFRVKTS